MTNIGCDSQPLLGFILHCYQHVYICFDFWLVTWRMFLVIWRFVRQMPDGNHCFWKSWLLTKYQFLEPGTLAWPSRLSYFRFHWWQSSTLYLSILVHHPTIEIAKKCVNLYRVNILHYKIVHQLEKSTLASKKYTGLKKSTPPLVLTVVTNMSSRQSLHFCSQIFTW